MCRQRDLRGGQGEFVYVSKTRWDLFLWDYFSGIDKQSSIRLTKKQQ